MYPEEKERQQIDFLLEQAGWKVQDREDINWDAPLGIAVRNFPLESGESDYLLFVNKKATEVVEAKPAGPRTLKPEWLSAWESTSFLLASRKKLNLRILCLLNATRRRKNF